MEGFTPVIRGMLNNPLVLKHLMCQPGYSEYLLKCLSKIVMKIYMTSECDLVVTLLTLLILGSGASSF